jgi:hypothetical protein
VNSYDEFFHSLYRPRDTSFICFLFVLRSGLVVTVVIGIVVYMIPFRATIRFGFGRGNLLLGLLFNCSFPPSNLALETVAFFLGLFPCSSDSGVAVVSIVYCPLSVSPSFVSASETGALRATNPSFILAWEFSTFRSSVLVAPDCSTVLDPESRRGKSYI